MRIVAAILSVLWIAGCAANYPEPRIEGLTGAEKAAILRTMPEGAKYIDPNSPDAMRGREHVAYDPVEVVDAPDATRRVRVDKCSSPVALRPFASSTVTLGDLVTYLRGMGVQVDVLSFGDVKVDMDVKVALSFPKGATLCALAETVTARTGFYMYVDEGVVTLSPYARRTFRIPVPVGTLRSEGKLESLADAGSDQTSSGGLGLNLTVTQEGNPVSEIEASLKKILGEKGERGTYVFSHNLGLLTVYAPPDVMAVVAGHIKNVCRELSRIAKVYVTILQVHDSGEKSHTFDWALAVRDLLTREPWKYGLTTGYVDWILKAPLPEEESVKGAFLFGPESIESPMTHKLLVHMLRTRADASVIENANFQIANGHPVVISKGQTQEYVSEVNRSVSDVEINYDVSKGRIHSGIRLFASGLVRENSVTLSLLVELQQLVRMETLNFEGILTIQNPTVNEKRQGLVVHAADGETKVLVGVAGTTKEIETATPGFIPFDIFYNSARKKKETDYIIILLTPQIIENERGGFYETV